jgi:hypothetical protein
MNGMPLRQPWKAIGPLALLALALPAVCLAADESLLGSLYVTTAPPGAAVYVSGELRGVSPCGIADVAAGTVEVRAERQGFGAASASAQVAGGKIARLDLTLPPLTNVGSIAVLVEPPGADIEVDRVPAGRTPKVLINVVAGTHRVTVSRPGLLPMHSTVTLAPGENSILTGSLASAAGAAGPAAADLGGVADLQPGNVPPTADLPEERAIEPVRKLVAARQYDDALAGLAQMADGASPELARRIGRERLVILRAREVVDAAYKQLREVEGQDYVLLLRGGIRYACTLVQVAGEDARVRIGDREQAIPLSRISAEQLVRLASHSMEPARAANRAKFALLYAAEGDYEPAYEELRAAAEAGYDASSDKSYVDAERLWAAALQKEAALRALAQSGSASEALQAGRVLKVLPLLVDTYHGRALPDEMTKLAQACAFDIRSHDGPFRPDEVEQPAVLLVYDPGPGAQVPAYDRQEVQHIVNFVKAGGGLVYVGGVRPVPKPQANAPPTEEADPFGALLRWTGVLVLPGALSVSKDAPSDFPRQYVPAYPATAHAVTAGVRQVVFAAPVAPLLTDRTAVMLLRASPLLLSEATGQPAPPVAAASALGKGRVLVFSALPLSQQSPWERSILNVNDGPKALLNGLMWVSDPAREASP